MAVSVKQMSLIVATLGILSFIFGIIAENKKPKKGTPIPGEYVVTCKYPSDPTVALGYLSLAFLIGISHCNHCVWVDVSCLPIQRKVCPKVCSIPKHRLCCILQHSFINWWISCSTALVANNYRTTSHISQCSS